MTQPGQPDTEVTIEEVKLAASQENHQKEISRRIQLISFKLGGEEYALPIDQIKEVVITPRIAKMPHTPEYIKGIANIRGNIIAILDLEQKFRISVMKTDEQLLISNYTLVVESELYKVGILVKEVPNTLTVNVADIDSTSNFVQYSALDEKTIQGVVKLGNRLIILIDLQKMMEVENIQGTVNKVIQ